MLEKSPVYRNLEMKLTYWGYEPEDALLIAVLYIVMFFFVDNTLVILGVGAAAALAIRWFKRGQRELFTEHFLRYHLKARFYSPHERDPRSRRYDPR